MCNQLALHSHSINPELRVLCRPDLKCFMFIKWSDFHVGMAGYEL